MKYLKLFESYNVDDIINKVDDIAAYMPTRTSIVESKWILPNFDVTRILEDKDYIKYNKSDKKYYLRYFIFGFNELSKFFIAESDIRNRAKSYGLKFFVINFNQQDRNCKCVFFTEEDWNKLDIEEVTKTIHKKQWDILFEEDVKIEKNEFDIIYEDDDIMAVKPKTYRAAIRYAADAGWKAALKKNSDWLQKYLDRGSYYGGTNWYVTKNVKQEVETWWTKLLKLPPKQSEKELKEFFQDFPRYLFYIVIFKRLPIEDDMSKLYLLYDVSRSEYGELPHPYTSNYVMFGGYWGDMLDAAHNQVIIVRTDGKRTTLRDIHGRHGELFNRAFREIEWDFNEEKEKMYDLLGFWSDKGGEYRDDALVFIRSSRNPERLQVVKKSDLQRDDKGVSWTRAGYYDDPDFDYWELDKNKPDEKVAPGNGRGYKDLFSSMRNSYIDLMNGLKNDDGEIKF
jgi:hypothetical protein